MTGSTTTALTAPVRGAGDVPPPSRRYGLDIETDTTLDGLDATRAAILAVAVSTEDGDEVLLGDELDILRRLDDLLAALPPGLLITWNGTFFDLPFIAARAELLGQPIGLRLGGAPCTEWPPARPPGPHRCSWGRHRHLDGYRLYRDDLGRSLGLSCGLKSLSRLVGLDPVEVDRTAMHLLDDEQMRAYVASDARLARQLVDRRMPLAYASADPDWIRPEHFDPAGTGPEARGTSAPGGPGPAPHPSSLAAAPATLH